MKIRKSLLPKSFQDGAVTCFMLLIIPTVYWYELFVVLPYFYTIGSGLYIFHFILGTFILANIVSNYLTTIVCDTSIAGKVLTGDKSKKGWHFCSVCECVTPPRAWHCVICNICILKRDHHCVFTGCCVGHFNLRYFLIFLFYMFIATLYASSYNVYFLWGIVELHSWKAWFKLVFPLAMLVLDFNISQLYLTLSLFVLIGCAYTGVLLGYHLNIMLHGMITYEETHLKSKMKHQYNYGVKQNVRNTLGERWYLVWVSAFLESKLEHDGIHWEVQETTKSN